jgi:hypothetical protein
LLNLDISNKNNKFILSHAPAINNCIDKCFYHFLNLNKNITIIMNHSFPDDFSLRVFNSLNLKTTRPFGLVIIKIPGGGFKFATARPPGV